MPNAHHPEGWSDGRVARLKELWTAGLSATQIAVDMGGLTRNAVIGKALRLGLTRPAIVKAINQKAANEQAAQTRAVHKTFGKPRAAPRAPPEPVDPEALDETPAPGPKPPTLPRDRPFDGVVVPMERLGSRSCRWPIGDPQAAGFGFCGARRPEGATYCDQHAQVARARVQPARQPRRA